MEGAGSDVEVRLVMPAVAGNVAVARQALAGLAESLEVEAALTADIKIAITEACTNAVVHAYPDDEGPLEVDMGCAEDRLTIVVRDRGPGFKPLPADNDAAPLGFGLALIASLSDAFAVRGSAAGTEVQMSFDIGEQSLAAPPPAPAPAVADTDPALTSPEVTLDFSAGFRGVQVLGRVVSLLAARADFPLDRLSDAQIVSDAIAAHAHRHALNGRLKVRILERDDGLAVRVGPLVAGGADGLLDDTDVPGVGRLLERLAADVAVEPVPGAGAPRSAEVLCLRLR